jgi:hypothetical protein
MKPFLALSMALLLAPVAALAQDKAAKPSEGSPPYPLPPPTLANVRYGPHERQVLDFWQTQKTQDPASQRRYDFVKRDALASRINRRYFAGD